MKMSTAHSLTQLRNFRILFIAWCHLGPSYNQPEADTNKYHHENRTSRGRVRNDTLGPSVAEEDSAPDEKRGNYLVGDVYEGRFQVSHIARNIHDNPHLVNRNLKKVG